MRKKTYQNKKIVLKDASEAWEGGAPSHEVIQKEKHLFKREIKIVLLSAQPLSLLLYKGGLTCTTISSECRVLPPFVKELLKYFGDVFPKEGTIDLPPFRGIEHQINLVIGTCLLNKPI